MKIPLRDLTVTWQATVRGLKAVRLLIDALVDDAVRDTPKRFVRQVGQVRRHEIGSLECSAPDNPFEATTVSS